MLKLRPPSIALESRCAEMKNTFPAPEHFIPQAPQEIVKPSQQLTTVEAHDITTEHTVQDLGEAIDSPLDNAAYEELVQAELKHMRAQQEARRRLAEEAVEDLPEPAIMTVEELLESDSPPERIEGLVPSGATVVIVARAKTGKTTFALNLVRSLLRGEPFLGQFPVEPEPGAIAYLNYEMGDFSFGTYCQPLGIGGDGFKAVGLKGLKSFMKNKTARSRLAKRLREINTTALVVDSLGQAFTGNDQNDNSEMLQWFAELEEWAREEIGVNEIYVISHAGKKASQGARGASAIEDVPDIIITLSLENPDRADSRRIVETRGRADDLPPHYLDFEVATKRLTLGEPKGKEARQEREKNSRRQALIDYVTKNEGESTNQIKKAVSGNSSNMTDTLKELVEEGVFRTEPGAHNATLYFLSSRGKKDS